MRQRQADAATQFLDEFALGGAAYARHRKASVNRRPDAGIEKIGLEEDLAIGNRDNVGGNKSRNVTGLGLYDRQCGQRAGLTFDLTTSAFFYLVGIDSGRPFEQARVQVKNISWICFTARWPPQQQADLAISPGLLGQIIVDNERIFTTVAKILAHGATRIGCNVLLGCRFGSGRRHHDGVIHRIVFFQFVHHVGNR